MITVYNGSANLTEHKRVESKQWFKVDLMVTDIVVKLAKNLQHEDLVEIVDHLKPRHVWRQNQCPDFSKLVSLMIKFIRS